jgi:hypothetical protein
MAKQATLRPIDRQIKAIERAMDRFLELTASAVVRGQTSAERDSTFRALGAIVEAIGRLTRSVGKEDRDTRIEIFLELEKLASPALEALIATMCATRDATLRGVCLKGLAAIASASHAGATAAIIEAAAEPVAGQHRPVPRAIRSIGELRLSVLQAITAELAPRR